MKCPRHTPLCPAGHLPLKGGEWLAGRLHTPQSGGDWQKPIHRLISPLEGEMSGRTEGGNCANGRNQPHPLCRMRTNVKRPLLPASGEKVRMRGERRQWPGYRQRWKRRQGTARPSSPCRDLLPAGGEKEAVILEAAVDWKNPQKHGPVVAPPPLQNAHQRQTPPSPRRRGEGEDEGRAPSVAGIPTEVEKTARRRMPLIPLPGPSPRLRGEGAVIPDAAIRWKSTQEHGPILAPPPLQNARQHQTPPSPRERGEGEDEGRAPSRARIPTEVEKTARRRMPLIPLPGPSPHSRGEGTRHPGPDPGPIGRMRKSTARFSSSYLPMRLDAIPQPCKKTF